MSSPDAYTGGPTSDLDSAIGAAWEEALTDIDPDQRTALILAWTFEAPDDQQINPGVGLIPAQPQRELGRAYEDHDDPTRRF